MAVPNIVVGDILRLRSTARLNGQTAIFGCDAKVTASGGAGLTVQQMADRFQVISELGVAPVMAVPALVTDCIVELVSTLTGRVLQSAHGVGTLPPGTAGPNAAPTQVAPVVAKHTGLAGPRNRGRIYFPFMSTFHLAPTGELTGGGVTAFNGAALFVWGTQTWSVGADSIVTAPILVHRYVAPAIPTYIDILTFVATGKIGTQKKRGDYGKPNPLI